MSDTNGKSILILGFFFWIIVLEKNCFLSNAEDFDGDEKQSDGGNEEEADPNQEQQVIKIHIPHMKSNFSLKIDWKGVERVKEISNIWTKNIILPPMDNKKYPFFIFYTICLA